MRARRLSLPGRRLARRPFVSLSLVVLIVGLGLVFWTAAASAQLVPILLTGDTAPNGGEFASFGPPAVNDSGDVAFLGSTVGPSATGVFKIDGATSVVTTIALVGDANPETGGTIFSLSDVVGIDGAGRVTLDVLLTGTTSFRGIFRGTGGALESIALANGAAPGTGGGTFLFINDHAVNASGEIVFGTSISNGTTSAGLFVHDGGVTTALLLAGDAAPGVPGESFVGFGDPMISADGSIAFQGLLTPTGTETDTGIFKIVGGTVSLVALAGDPAPDTGSALDVFDDIVLRDPSINDSGDVVFRSAFGPLAAPDAQGVFIESGGVLAAHTLAGDTPPLPLTLPYDRFTARPLLSASGAVVVDFIPDGGPLRLGLTKHAATGDEAIAFEGQNAPGTGTGPCCEQAVASLGAPAMNDMDTVVFRATLSSGPIVEGLFAVPEPSGLAPLLLGGLTLASAARRRARALPRALSRAS